jgi:hypothetical protein
MLFDFLIQPLREPPLRGSPPLRKGIVIKGGWIKKSKSISASVGNKMRRDPLMHINK